MELQTENRIYKRNPLLCGAVRVGLLMRAKHLVQATKKSETAKKEILYRLPGVFSMRLRAGKEEVRLIKEADELRIMKKTEKSVILLSINFEDNAELGDVMFHETTMPRALSEGRVHFDGAPKYMGVILRVDHEGDKCVLSNDKYAELYGESK